MWYLSASSKRRTEGVHPDLLRVRDRALEICPIDFGHPAHAGKRSDDEQLELFNSGASQCDGIKKRSRHQDAKAIDFYAYVNGRASWEPRHLVQVAAAFLQAASELGVRIAWGGHWKGFKDMPHVQLID